jgi:outer membrane protein assembly factor BamB
MRESNKMKLLFRWSQLVLFSLTISGCGTINGWFISDDDEINQPAELEKIVQRVKIKKLWSTGVGDGQGKGLYKITPLINGDVIYAASAEGEIKALARNRGKAIWKEELETPLSGGVGYHGGYLFLGTSEGKVLKLDADSGEQLWSTRLNGEILAAPQANGRIVVVQSYDGKLQGLDYDSGEKLWTYDSNVPVLTIRGTSTPILDNNRVYAGFANGRVQAFDANTGAVAWEVRVAISQGRSEIERIVDVDGTMVLLGTDLYAASYQGKLVAIDVSTGRKIWQQDASSYGGVSQGFGNIYVTDEDGTISAYQRNGQGLRWQQGDLAYRGLSRPVPVSSYVAVADFEGIVHLVSQVDGEFVGRVKVDGDGVRADMLTDGNRLYVFGNSGKLIAYEITAKE